MLKVEINIGTHTITYTEDDTRKDQSFAELVREVTHNDYEAVKEAARQLGFPVNDITIMTLKEEPE